jgi:pimeloyl-ACP methyl ester carboxylesterase
MAAVSPKISTIVRFDPGLVLLRTRFRVGALLRPRHTLERAGQLFSTPMAGSRQRALQVRTAGVTEGVTESDIEVAGHRVHTYAWGDPQAQPYVLFAHGWSSHGTRFLPWVPRLREAGHAVVAFDQPAHGRSSGQRSNLSEFVRALEAVAARFGPAAAVVGHSLGGAAVATALARGLPAERAVLIAPAADPVDAAMRFAGLVGLPQLLCQRMIAAFEAHIGFSFDAFQAHFNAPRIARPALIVHDVEDREVPWAEGERYARFWPDSRLLSTRGLGHNRIAQDEGVITAALRFLRGEAVGERVVSSPNLPYGIA